MAIGLLVIGWTFAFVSLFVAVAQKISWLDYLYYFSYIKLGVTLVKYIPQVQLSYLTPYLHKNALKLHPQIKILSSFTQSCINEIQRRCISYVFCSYKQKSMRTGAFKLQKQHFIMFNVKSHLVGNIQCVLFCHEKRESILHDIMFEYSHA